MTTQPEQHEHEHAEAFALMIYVSDDRQDAEIIWNSRDGVTPMVITLKSGRTGTHMYWRGSLYAPGHRPRPGDRVFIDMTDDMCRTWAGEAWDKFIADAKVYAPERPTPPTRDEFIAAEVAQHRATPGRPALVEWTYELAQAQASAEKA